MCSQVPEQLCESEADDPRVETQDPWEGRDQVRLSEITKSSKISCEGHQECEWGLLKVQDRPVISKSETFRSTREDLHLAAQNCNGAQVHRREQGKLLRHWRVQSLRAYLCQIKSAHREAPLHVPEVVNDFANRPPALAELFSGSWRFRPNRNAYV